MFPSQSQQILEVKRDVPKIEESPRQVVKSHPKNFGFELDRELFTADTCDYFRKAKLGEKRPDMEPIFLNEEEESLSAILRLIDKGYASLGGALNKHLLSIIGETGCGKSTFANWMLGCEMVKKACSHGLPKIDAIESKTIIGHSDNSQTDIPELFDIQDSNKGAFALVDFPGYFATEGAKVSIAHAVNIRNVFTHALTNRVLILISYDAIFGAKAKSLRGLVDILTMFFNNIENLNYNRSSILVGVTHLRKKAKQNFKSVIEEIIAKAVTQKWHLNPEQIIPINALYDLELKEKEATHSSGAVYGLSRKETLDKLMALNPINSKEMFQVVLTPGDKLLVGNLFEAIAKNIDKCWQRKNYRGIREAYSKMRSLDCFAKKDTEKTIEELQLAIKNHVANLIKFIKEKAASGKPEDRCATLEGMADLHACQVLDFCLESEHRTILEAFLQAEKEIEQIEYGLQLQIYQQIETELSELIKLLRAALKNIKKEHQNRLSTLIISTTQPLEHLAREFPQFGVFKQLVLLFEQIDIEMNARLNRYYCKKDLVPLTGLKKEKLETIHQIIELKVDRAINKYLTEQAQHALKELNSKEEVLIQEEYVSLSESVLTLREFNSLVMYRLIEKEVKCVALAYAKLCARKASVYKLEGQIEETVKRLHMKAQAISTQRKIEGHVIAIGELLTELLQQARKQTAEILNEHFTELARLDLNQDIFLEMQKKVRSKLVDAPQKILKEVMEQPINNSYRAVVAKNIEIISFITSLPACFHSAQETIKILQDLTENLKEHETKRYNTKINSFRSEFSAAYKLLEMELRSLAKVGFKGVLELALNPKDIDDCLLKLVEKYPSWATSVRDTCALIDDEIAHQGLRYFFLDQDPQLGQIKQATEKLLSRLMLEVWASACAHFYAYKIDDCLKRMRKEAKKCIAEDPLAVKKLGVKAFSENLQTEIKQYFENLSRILEQVTLRGCDKRLIEEVRVLLSESSDKSSRFEEKLKSQASEKALESTLEILQSACNKREFLSIADRLPSIWIT